MPVRSSPYFNNEAFAQAASNLSSLFEPPSGADAAGFALADERRQNAQRLQELFDYSTNPEFNQQTFDRMGLGSGAWTPNQSYHAVELGDATTRRGQDVTAATSRSNNAADNARALQQTQIGSLTDLYGPLSEGQVAPAVPDEIAAILGAPGAIEQRNGREKPLSETELKAQILQTLDPSLQQDIVASDMNVESIQTPEGPRVVSRADAINQPPLIKDSGGLTVTTNPDGTTTVTQGVGKITEAGGKKINFGVTAEKLLPVMEEVGAELTSLSGATADKVPLLGNYAQTEKYQQARLAGERFTQAILRNESGAATPDAEIARYMSTFLPVPGDKPGTIKLKSYLRHVAVEALKGGMSKDERVAAIDAAISAGVPADFGVAVGNPPTADAATPAPAAAPVPAGGPVKFVRGADGKLIRGQ